MGSLQGTRPLQRIRRPGAGLRGLAPPPTRALLAQPSQGVAAGTQNSTLVVPLDFYAMLKVNPNSGSRESITRAYDK